MSQDICKRSLQGWDKGWQRSQEGDPPALVSSAGAVRRGPFKGLRTLHA